jgi:hypothetical protein
MSTYPNTPRSAFITWCQAHQNVFTANAAEIGLSDPQATAFANATTAAAAAVLAQEQAHQAAKVATQAALDAVAALKTTAGDTVRLIRAYAETQTNPSVVYQTAQIPPPATPSPAPPPAQPIDLTVTLEPGAGNLTLGWKAANPVGTSGTTYIIRRKLPGESVFTFLGVSGKKTFVDGTLIAGPDSVQYTVQGQRADSSGPLSPIFTVNFGQAPGGGVTATVSTSAKTAAIGGQTLHNGNGNAISSNGHTNGNGQSRRELSRV